MEHEIQKDSGGNPGGSDDGAGGERRSGGRRFVGIGRAGNRSGLFCGNREREYWSRNGKRRGTAGVSDGVGKGEWRLYG